MIRTYWVRREFNPSWVAVAKAWTKVSSSERDSHFFATLDFETSQTIFRRVIHHLLMKASGSMAH